LQTYGRTFTRVRVRVRAFLRLGLGPLSCHLGDIFSSPRFQKVPLGSF
jgi:hypothetical protein